MKEATAADRERIVAVVKDGRTSDYWSILKGFIVQWKIDESAILEAYKLNGGIKTEADRHNYNRVVDRIAYLDRLLKANEEIIEHNESVINKVKATAREAVKKAESFLSVKF